MMEKGLTQKRHSSQTKYNILRMIHCFVVIYGDEQGCPDPFGTPLFAVLACTLRGGRKMKQHRLPLFVE